MLLDFGPDCALMDERAPRGLDKIPCVWVAAAGADF